MDEIDRRADALVSSPIGCAFLIEVERLGGNPELGADPVRSFHLVGRAVIDVTVWRADHELVVRQVLAEGPRLRPLARAILARPEAAWWFAPVDRRAQLIAVHPHAPIPAGGVPTSWERYAQKPAWGLVTSTAFNGISAMLVGADACVGDLGPLRLPAARELLVVPAHARVYEVDGPRAWRRLCLTYPAPEPGGLAGGLVVPDFLAVARDWDAVHLSMGGLLTSDQIRLDGPEGATELLGWDAESTVWLRPPYERRIRLPDLTDHIPIPPELR